jgi:hypothetical protein
MSVKNWHDPDRVTERTKRCQAMTASRSQCKCWSTCYVNKIPYCDQHGAIVVRETFEANLRDAALAIEQQSGTVVEKPNQKPAREGKKQ